MNLFGDGGTYQRNGYIAELITRLKLDKLQI